MKKFRLIGTFLFAAIATSSFSQGLKFTAFGGYTVQDKVYGYYGDVIIGDGTHFGGILSYERTSNMSIDLTYSYQPTTFSVKDYSIAGNQSGGYSGTVSYLMLGTTHSPDFNAKFAPYGGIMLGAAIFNSKSGIISETWKFAVGLKLGGVYHINDKFGIVIQTQLMIPVQGVGLAIGTGGVGAGTSSSATQLGFTGGLEIKLRK